MTKNRATRKSFRVIETQEKRRQLYDRQEGVYSSRGGTWKKQSRSLKRVGLRRRGDFSAPARGTRNPETWLEGSGGGTVRVNQKKVTQGKWMLAIQGGERSDQKGRKARRCAWEEGKTTSGPYL